MEGLLSLPLAQSVLWKSSIQEADWQATRQAVGRGSGACIACVYVLCS